MTATQNLPLGWAWVCLKDVADLKGGITKGQKRKPDQTLRSVPYLRVANVQRGFLDLAEVREIDATEEEIAELRLERGDVLFNEGGDRDKLGRGWIWRGELPECIHQNHVFRARIRDDVADPRYISWYGNSVGQSYFIAEGNQTTNLASLNLTKLGQLPVKLPPLAEQRRVVAAVEEQFTRLDSAVASLQRARANLKRYRRSVLKAFVEGRLRVEARNSAKVPPGSGTALVEQILKERRHRWVTTRGEHRPYPAPAPLAVDQLPSIPPNWGVTSLDSLVEACRPICYGILMPKEHVPNGVTYVKVRDMKGDRLELESLQRTAPEIAAKYARASLKSGDLLLAIRGTYGRVVEVPPELDGGNITQDTARLAITGVMDRRFVALHLRSELSQGYFAQVARGMAVKGVNIADVKRTPIVVPPLDDQHRIVEVAEQRLSAIDLAEAAVTANLKRAERLRQAVLRRAFEGKLVPQDPTDQPASVLLERVRNERSASSGTALYPGPTTTRVKAANRVRQAPLPI